MSSLHPYKILVEFLGQALGPDYEVVLHDLKSEKSQIVAIANSKVSGRSVGAPLTNVALKFIAEKTYEKKNFVVGYCGMSPEKVPLFCSTMFIKDDSEKLIGMLCINFDGSRYKQAVSTVAQLCSHMLSPQDRESAELANPETFVGSVKDSVHDAIEEAFVSLNLPTNRLTMEEKVRIVDRLNQNGLFYLKGAVSEVANALGTSEATVYRYLSKLKT